MSPRRLVLVVFAVILGLIAGIPLTGSATQRLGESPHGRTDRCLVCHIATETGAPGAPLPTIKNCRSCHPDADMHPVGMRPEHIKVHEGWPLEDGVVTCATCHAESACDPKRSTVAPWLRDGTPERKADFCNRCHEVDTHLRKSPHLPFGETDVSKAGCQACHGARPDPGASPEKAHLLTAPGRVCATCHTDTPHAGAAAHLGKVLDPGRLSKESARSLPLAPGNVIACWTCHDVHNAPHAVKPPNALSLALGETREDEPDKMLALPASDGTLCRACHGDGP